MSDSTDHSGVPIGRGVFLAGLLGGVSALWWGRDVWSRVSSTLSPVESLVPLVPTKGWRIYTVASSMPEFDQASWRLELDGHVDRPQALTYDELLALPKATQVSTFHCVTGWTVKNVRWGGVRLADVLDRAEPTARAHA